MKFYFSVIFLFTSLAAFAADVFVTLHKENLTEIKKETVVKILKAEMLSWDGGYSINLLINDLSETKSEDVETLVDMSKRQFLEFWRIKFFSGRALLPKQVKNVSSILPLLTENKYSIYISIGKTPEKDLTDHPRLKTTSFKF